VTAELELLVVLFMFLFVYVPLPVHGSATLVQQNNGGNNSCLGCGNSVAISFSNPVVAGNTIVAGITSVVCCSVTLVSISDTLHSTFTQAVQNNNGGKDFVYIYYATLVSSGSDTITVTFPGNVGGQNLYIYEVSGVTTTGVATGIGQGVGTSAATTSTSFQGGAFLLGIVAVDSGGNTWTAGTGFTPSTDNTGHQFSFAEWSDPPLSPTTFQAGLRLNVWAEVGIALNPAPTPPPPPIPEYPFGLAVLAIFMIIGYGVIRRPTRSNSR
jgi:hypothetical protein